jgi:hypothetical protein
MSGVMVEQEKEGGSAPSSARSEPLHSDLEARRASGTTPLDVLEHVKETDAAHPMHWSLWKKWFVITVYCLLQVYVTMTSTMYVSVETFIQERFPSTLQVVTLDLCRILEVANGFMLDPSWFTQFSTLVVLWRITCPC